MRRKFIAALSLGALLMVGSGCTPEPIVAIPSLSNAIGEAPLRVAAAQVPAGVDAQEGVLVAHVYAAALNAAGAKAEVAAPAAAAGAAVSVVAAGTLDIAPVFSREAMAGAMPGVWSASPAEVLSALEESLPTGVELLDPAKAQDETRLVVTAVTAERFQLKTMADLGERCGKVAMGGSAEFRTHPRGLAALGSDYNCVPQQFKELSPSASYGTDSTLWALLRDDIQLAIMHNSSPAIADNALVVLDDPKDSFPAQDLVPVVSTARVTDEVQAVVDKVSGALTEGELANLNRLAQDRHFGSLAEAAEAWLVQKGLIEVRS